MSDFHQTIQQAEGYLELGMISEAWEATEELEPIQRSNQRAVEIRLRIATRAERWELGEALANVLICSDVEPERCRETCARFRHANARRLIQAGLDEMAKAEIKKAIEAWPHIRKQTVDAIKFGSCSIDVSAIFLTRSNRFH